MSEPQKVQKWAVCGNLDEEDRTFTFYEKTRADARKVARIMNEGRLKNGKSRVKIFKVMYYLCNGSQVPYMLLVAAR